MSSLSGNALKYINEKPKIIFKEVKTIAFFASAVDVLQTLVIALGAGLGIWGVINLLEGYGNDSAALISM